MKVLVYGFKSYKHWKKNITEQVLDKIPENKNLVKVAFPLRYNKKIFLKKIKETMPDIIIGLGQHEVGDMFRVERKAVNVKRRNQKTEPSFIFQNKPHHYFLTLMLEEDIDSWHSYDAGDDISNYSMYVISHLCKNIKFAFIHIPKNMDVEKAAKYVNKKILESAKEFMPEGEQAGLSKFYVKKEVISQ